MDLPSYDELPIRDGLPAGSAWGLWGDDDEIGTINLLTPERIQRALGCPHAAPFPDELGIGGTQPAVLRTRCPAAQH